MKGKREIRKLVAEDWEQFEILDKELFPDDRRDRNQFLHDIKGEGCFGLFIEDDLEGQLTVARFGDDEAHLARIAVSKSYQGKGYGSMLMDYAIQWYEDQGGIKTVHLYTQEDNYTAQGLYKKYGFTVTGTTWHHFVPLDSIHPIGKYTCQEIQEGEVDIVGEKYEGFPAAQIRRILESDRSKYLTLKDEDEEIVGACRFSLEFPGCFPFFMDIPEAFDDFIFGLEPFSLPKFDYVRVTYTDIPEVAKICEDRGYKLHHKLFKFSLTLHG
ncbi:MAG: GNAT family N-acetyltransferase [Candidatus Thorarchaeota archaeon]|jgi:ribosomal protein S18 acetylase RimI-like enzyme